MMPRIIVLGIGNIVLGDEGFGVRAMEQVRDSAEYGDNIEFIDGGTLGMELLPFITGTDRLLILDAVKGDGGAGKVYCFRGDEVDAHFADKLSAHEIGIQDVLTVLKLTGQEIPEVVVIGAEPFVMEAGLDLSVGMAAVLPTVCRMAREEILNWCKES